MIYFEDFVKPAEEGGGADMKLVKRLCGDDPEALDLIDQTLQNPVGNNVPTQEGRPEGNSAEKAIRRLRKDRPDLHARVIAGEVSPHAAMIQAGFRPQTITVPIDPATAGRRLARHFDADQFAAIAEAFHEAIEGTNRLVNRGDIR